MADWITDVDDTESRLERWNRRGGVMRTSGVLNDPANQVPVAIFMVLDDVLTPAEVTALENLLTDESMPSATSLNYLSILRPKISTLRIAGGIKAPADLIAVPGKTWTALGELRVRCDDTQE